jgi:aryl carrier-like protein
MTTAELSVSEATHGKSPQYGPLKGQCCIQPGKMVRGTFFIGGAGMDGLYIPHLVKALQNARIKSAVYLDREKWSRGVREDAVNGTLNHREYSPKFPGLLRIRPNSFKQFNLIGYSYGSLMAAQLAAKYGRNGTDINHLVLIGSPIARDFLTMLRGMKTIKKTIVINLDKQGDPIFAGMDMIDLLTCLPKLGYQHFLTDGEGHFYYSKEGATGHKRHQALAEALYKLGLR